MNYGTDPNCFICGKETNGTFSAAPQIEERVHMIRKKQMEMKDDKSEEAGGDLSEENTTVTKIKQAHEASDTDSNGLTAEEKAIMAENKES